MERERNLVQPSSRISISIWLSFYLSLLPVFYPPWLAAAARTPLSVQSRPSSRCSLHCLARLTATHAGRAAGGVGCLAHAQESTPRITRVRECPVCRGGRGGHGTTRAPPPATSGLPQSAQSQQGQRLRTAAGQSRLIYSPEARSFACVIRAVRCIQRRRREE